MTLMGEILRECNNMQSSISVNQDNTFAVHNANCGQVAVKALSSLANIFARSPPDLFNMLLAQQLPSILCDCITPDSSNMRRQDGGGEYKKEYPGFPFLHSTNVRVIHTLAVLLLSSHNAVYPMPLEKALHQQQRKRSIGIAVPANEDKTSDNSPIDFESASTHVMLRQRVCRLLGEKLTDRNCKKLNTILDLLYETFSPRLSNYLPDRLNGDTPIGEEIYSVFCLRVDILTLLIHVSYFFGRYACLSICQYRNGSIVSALINSLGSDELMLGNATESSQKRLLYCIGHGKALSLQLLRYFCMYSTLLEAQVVASVNACKQLLQDDMSVGDKKIISCTFSLLACVYKFALTKMEIAVTATDTSITSKAREILFLVEKSAMMPRILDSMSELLSYLFTASEKESRINDASDGIWTGVRYSFGAESQRNKPQTKADTTFWVLGYEFGVRQHGMLDGVLELLSLLVESRNEDIQRFFRESQGISFSEMICQQIHCTVSIC